MGSALEQWLQAQGFCAQKVEPLAGDVSARRYYRVTAEGGSRAILAWYPPEMSKAYERFVSTTSLLRSAGIKVPEILTLDQERAWMLIQDLGEKNLFEQAVMELPRETYFRQAITAIKALQGLSTQDVGALNPPLDGTALADELEKTRSVFLEPKGLVPAGSLGRDFENFLQQVCSDLGAGPLVPCHRDFMARNLVAVPEGDETAVAVIDHQDLRLGPRHYDLASLLNDSFFPAPTVERELLRWAKMSASELVPYRKAAIQRTLKAVGTFASFAERGSEVHLPLIPPTLGRTLYHLSALPDMTTLADHLSIQWKTVLGEFC